MEEGGKEEGKKSKPKLLLFCHLERSDEGERERERQEGRSDEDRKSVDFSGTQASDLGN